MDVYCGLIYLKTMTQNDFAKYWIENGILFFIYKDDIDIDLNAAIKIVEDRINYQNHKNYPVLADFRKVKINKEGRDYLAKAGSKNVTACAVLTDSPVNKIMANFYLKIDKPVTPTKMFTEKEEAIKWLAQFLDKI